MPLRTRTSLRTSLSIGERSGHMMVSAVPEPIKAVLGKLGAALCRTFRSRRRFTFRGVDYPYFYHGYKLTWMTERGVEVPIVLGFVNGNRGKQVLEVGNVLQHYFPVDHDVLDKYEAAPGVANSDVIDFDPGKRYDLIVSISTVEHVGFDEDPKEPRKVSMAMDRLRGLLAPGGTMVVTVPLGYNPEIDRLVEQEWPAIADIYYMMKTSRWNDWEEVGAGLALKAAAEKRFFWLNGLAVLVITGRGDESAEQAPPVHSNARIQ